LIRENKIAQMYSSIQTGQSHGMQTLDQHLLQLVNNRMVSLEEARPRAVDKSKFTQSAAALSRGAASGAS
jgi:twitching motility protein PilT